MEGDCSSTSAPSGSTSHAQPHNTSDNPPKKTWPLQTTMTEFAVRPIQVNKARQYDLQLTKMIVKVYHPFYNVEEPEFDNL